MKIRGFLHLYVGEEAVAAGVMPAITLADAVISTYLRAWARTRARRSRPPDHGRDVRKKWKAAAEAAAARCTCSTPPPSSTEETPSWAADSLSQWDSHSPKDAAALRGDGKPVCDINRNLRFQGSIPRLDVSHRLAKESAPAKFRAEPERLAGHIGGAENQDSPSSRILDLAGFPRLVPVTDSLLRPIPSSGRVH